jgi:hypothetical protein
MANPQQYAINNLLLTYTGQYRQQDAYGAQGIYPFYLNPHKPIFARFWIPIMMNDPHIWYGMELLKGPIISKAKYIVNSENPEVAEYVDRQIKNFWRKGIITALDCLTWGYSGSEVLYEYNQFTGTIDFKNLKYLHPRDVKAITNEGEFAGVQIRNVRGSYRPNTLNSKKVFWTVHDRKSNRWYGRSRLQGAFEPWWETSQPKGYRSIRHLWFYRHAFSGGVLYYPDGTTQDPDTGEEVANALIAQEMLDRKETGSSLALPNRTGDNRDWEWEDAKSSQVPEGLLDYGDILRDEMWEGIGVPPEVAKNEGTGSFAGRRVPQQAFYSYLQEIANNIINDFEEQVLRGVLVPLVFGEGAQFTIEPVSILQTLQQEEMGLVTGSIPQEGELGNPEEQGPSMAKGDMVEGEEEENPDESQDNPFNKGKQQFGKENKLSNGRLEDRSSNAFNLSEKALKNSKKKFGGK